MPELMILGWGQYAGSTFLSGVSMPVAPFLGGVSMPESSFRGVSMPGITVLERGQYPRNGGSASQVWGVSMRRCKQSNSL